MNVPDADAIADNSLLLARGGAAALLRGGVNRVNRRKFEHGPPASGRAGIKPAASIDAAKGAVTSAESTR
jgi:hypothetical protein